MGIDKSLSDQYPSVIINGRKYHYGREPEHGQYLVENASYAKDYWCFDEKQDLRAFLTNLPESADRGLRRRLHPDWGDVTPEQRNAYFDQDKLLFRAWADEKVKNGTAQSFIMDLEGEHGPYHEPQRIEPRSAAPPLDRLERQLADYKAAEAARARSAGYPIEPDEWPRGYNEPLKLRVLEGELDWSGVGDKEKEAVLAREVDFGKISRDQLNFVYEDIAFGAKEDVDERAARRLFDKSNFAKAVAEADQASFGEQLAKARDTTRNLIEAVAMDAWPRSGAIVDFGIDSQRHYEALYYPIRNEEITPSVLDAAMGYGEKLTELVRDAPSNLHKDIQFHTSWDELLGRQKPADMTATGVKDPRAAFSEILNASPKAARESVDREKGRER